ncbi:MULTISPECIES: DeoR/GlpR family DNA-binding transcription regulator [unclassified Enterococcus]|uniref:DeoR/GlpR family DNA-binding transcription regulator n=1 Tax=unclassified Enterococcus TaxID=2608891 RepID=UPI001A91AA76|nr:MULTISPECIES: DeoR/GlpR family DNA-binding transcription regulator [unclassified Enterococcus]MBO0462587.1 DeoR/GlpR transcriptional regulator [Enterococcus sp. DIV1298c]MBO1300028.1 DeoR/GlpR transcriptional regulator [Enterococcus sp. DIV1271a]
MLKEERLNKILELVNINGVVDVNELMAKLNVSDMTIRRDLGELEKTGKLKRVHGGAQSMNFYKKEELSHEKKMILNPEEKKEIVLKAKKFIAEEDTIFLGPGTTIELLAQILDFKHLRIITNSLPVFNILQTKHEDYQIYLVGGQYRPLTGAFLGEMANKVLADIRFGKAFVGANAVKDNRIMTATLEEGTTQQIALNNSSERYLLVDSSKLDCEDFYTFFSLSNLTALITGEEADSKHSIDSTITVY